MYKKLSPIDYQNKKRRNDSWQLLDVREPWELNVAKIDNTINIPIKKHITMFGDFDCVIITNMEDINARYIELLKIVSKEKIIIPVTLGGNIRNFHNE